MILVVAKHLRGSPQKTDFTLNSCYGAFANLSFHIKYVSHIFQVLLKLCYILKALWSLLNYGEGVSKYLSLDNKNKYYTYVSRNTIKTLDGSL